MSTENQTNLSQDAAAEKSAIASFGATQRVVAHKAPEATTTPASDVITVANTTDQGNEAPELTDEQLKAFFDKKGIAFEGIDSLKKKLEIKVDAPVDTEEQKLQRESAKERRMVDLFIQNKGTIEQFAALKNLANADVSELSQSELTSELKSAGFNDDEAKDILKERFYQIADDELDQFEDESEKEFLKRKKAYGSKLMENHAQSIKTQAGKVLSDLRSAVDSEDLQTANEVELSSKIDEHFSNMPRKYTFELGTENNRVLDPITYEVSESDLAEIKETLKDPAKRNNIYYTENGEPNIDSLATLIARNKILESALKTAYLTGETKATELVKRTFGSRSATEVGLGANSNTAIIKGVAVKAGSPQRVSPNQR